MPINLDHTGAAVVSLQSTATLLQVDKSITVTGDVTANTFIGNLSGTATQVSNSVIFNNTGTGDLSGILFNGSTLRTVSYNTLGAAAIGGGNATGTWPISITGSAPTLTTSRSISATGDGSWTVNFNGSANVTSTLTLATVNASPQIDTLRKITVNGKGLTTATSAVTSSDLITALGYTPANSAGNTFTGIVTVPQLNIDTNAVLDSTGVTTTSVTPTVLATFPTTTFGSAKILVQATVAPNRQISELLITHNGTTAIATEYAVLITGSRLFTCQVDIVSGSVRLLVTSSTGATTVYRCLINMLAA